MDKQSPDFTEELVDAQIDWLLTDQSQSTAYPSEKHIVKDLQQMYQNDERSLSKVWQRLGLENGQQQSMKNQREIFSRVHETRKSADARPSSERRPPMQQVHKPSFVRTFSLIAAVCVAVVITGSLLFVFNLARQNQGQNTVSPVTFQDVYASDTSSIFKLNTQTHQTLWRQPIPGMLKIIPAGDAIYVLQRNTGPENPGAVLKLDASTGKTLWTQTFIVPQTSHRAGVSDIALVQDHIYVSWNDVLSNPAGDPTHADKELKPSRISVLKTVDGSQITSFTLDPTVKHIWSLVINADVIAASTDAGLVVTNLAGKPLWHTSFPASTNNTVNSLQFANGLLYAVVLDRSEKATNGEMATSIRSYNATTGEQTWKSPDFATDALTSFTVNQNIVYFGATYSPQPGQKKPFSGRVYAYDMQSNKQLWSVSVGGATYSKPLFSNGFVYFAVDSGPIDILVPVKARVMAIDATTGAIRWQQILTENYATTLFMTGGVVYMGTYNVSQQRGIAWGKSYALKASDGTRLWEDSQHHMYTIATSD